MAQVLGTGKQRAGDQSRISLNNGVSFLNFASWDVTITGVDIDTLNFGSYVAAPTGWEIGQSFEEGILGPIGSSQTWGGLWDGGTNPMGDPPGIFPRDDLANTLFVVNRTDNTEFSFPYQRIRSVNIKTDVKGGVGFDVRDAKNQGQFSFPTASV